MRVRRIFIDANIFIEMRDLDALDWQTLFPGLGEICIVVSMHVIKELDKLKNDRTERRRKRARAALHIIDRVPQRGRSILREQPYSVTLEVAFPRLHRWQEYHLLDENDPDDRLVAHLIEDGGGVLVSDDTGIRIKASEYCALVVEPPASFRLPPEESADRKKVRELTQIIQDLEDKRPRVMVKLGCPSDPIVLVRPLLKPMPDDLQDELVRRILAANPKLRKPQNDSGIHSLSRRPNPVDWVKYEFNYASFTERVKQHVTGFHDKLNSVPMALEIPFDVINTGRVTLENADVAIRLEGDARLYIDEGENSEEESDHLQNLELEFPRAPIVELSYALSGVCFGAISSLQILRIRFPGVVSFEWDVVPDDKNTPRANLSNKEFAWESATLTSSPSYLRDRFRLTCDFLRAGSQRFRQGYRRNYCVRIEPAERDWTLGDWARVEAALPDEVRKIG